MKNKNFVKGYVCRSRGYDQIHIAYLTGNFKKPDMKTGTGRFWHIPGWFHTMSVWRFKKYFGFSVKPGTFKLINILISEKI